MPYAADQDLSVPYAKCSPENQAIRTHEALRAWRELHDEYKQPITVIGRIAPEGQPVWRGMWFSVDTAGHLKKHSTVKHHADPIDALLHAAKEMEYMMTTGLVYKEKHAAVDADDVTRLRNVLDRKQVEVDALRHTKHWNMSCAGYERALYEIRYELQQMMADGIGT